MISTLSNYCESFFSFSLPSFFSSFIHFYFPSMLHSLLLLRKTCLMFIKTSYLTDRSHTEWLQLSLIWSNERIIIHHTDSYSLLIVSFAQQFIYSFTYSSFPTINIIVRTDQFVDTTVRDAETNMVCDRPRDNWLVFTAGCMGAGEGRGENMDDTEDL